MAESLDAQILRRLTSLEAQVEHLLERVHQLGWALLGSEDWETPPDD